MPKTEAPALSASDAMYRDNLAAASHEDVLRARDANARCAVREYLAGNVKEAEGLMRWFALADAEAKRR